MEFRTEIKIDPLRFQVAHKGGIFTVGSCFADNIAAKLAVAKFRVEANPLGVMFNPVSAAECLIRLLDGKDFTIDDLSTDGDLWFSYLAHGCFSSPDRARTLDGMNKAFSRGATALKQADTVVMTLGTAWVYEREGRVVANCHKSPAAEFTRRRLTVAEVTDAIEGVMRRMPEKNFLLTVSPIRHVKDGLAENSISKATLLLAVGAVVERNARAEYFPSYEIMLDDLRDYRFYGADMVHPSAQAVDYIWEKFRAAAMSPATAALSLAMEKITTAAGHRPINCGSAAHRMFMESMAARCRRLADENPCVDLSQEIKYFDEKAL